MLTIRKSRESDLPVILNIYAEARLFMKEHGNPRQWGDKRPPEEQVIRDIREDKSYVCLDDERICGVFFYDYGNDIEPTYRKIEGAWKDDSAYGIVHRIASDHSLRGIGTYCLEWAYGQCGHLRIDTHPDNIVMQKLLEKLGFVKCGTIHVVEDNDPRFAYERSERI